MEVYRKRVEYRLIDVALASFFFLLCPINWINSFRSGESGRGRKKRKKAEAKKGPPRTRNFSPRDRTKNLAQKKAGGGGKVGTKIWMEVERERERTAEKEMKLMKFLNICNADDLVIPRLSVITSLQLQARMKRPRESCPFSVGTELDEVGALR